MAFDALAVVATSLSHRHAPRLSNWTELSNYPFFLLPSDFQSIFIYNFVGGCFHPNEMYFLSFGECERHISLPCCSKAL